MDPLTWNLFRRCRPLSGLSDLAMREMFAAAEERAYQPEALMMRPGDPPDGPPILL